METYGNTNGPLCLVIGGPPRDYVRPGERVSDTDREELIEMRLENDPLTGYLSMEYADDAAKLLTRAQTHRVASIVLYGRDNLAGLAELFPWSAEVLKQPFDDWFEIYPDGKVIEH